MEFGAREMMIALGALVALAILLDVVRRIRNARYEKIHMPRRKQPIFDDEDVPEGYGSELPSGGARVVGYRDDSDVEQFSRQVRERAEANKPKLTMPKREPLQSSLNLDEVPKATKPPRVEPQTSAPEPVATAPATATDLPAEAEAPAKAAKKAPAPAPATKPPLVRVVVMHMMAGPEPFAGTELLDALLGAGLRYGSMKIFHRHVNEDGSGPVQFSVANSVNPGTFDLDSMEDFSTPGVSLFFAMEDVDDPMMAFDLLLTAAKEMAISLDGVLKDESRSVLTRQTEEHYRQRITDYCRSQLSGIE
ncbi:cell division protein ZipA [Porticoccus sp.]